MSGILSPVHILIITTLLLLLSVTSIYLILKSEKDPARIGWILLAVLIPFAGPLIYFGKYFISNNPDIK